MSRIALLVVAGLYLLPPGPAHGQQLPSDYEHLKPLEWLNGQWAGEYVATSDLGAVKKGDQSLLKSDYADAVKSLAVCLAANESMSTGEAVKV